LRRLPDAVIVAKFYVIDFLPLLNFLTDPLIYGVRMREIRRAYRRLAAVVLPCWRAADARRTAGTSELGTSCRMSVVAMTTTTRTDSRSTAHESRRTARSLLDTTEFTLHDD